MLGKIIGAIAGEKIAERHGESGAKGAVIGAVASSVVRRLSLPALLAVGGVAAWRRYRRNKDADVG